MRLARSLFILMVALTASGSAIAADRFTRGDVDQSGRISIGDAIHILEALFGGGSAVSCEDAADVDDNGSLTATDPVFILESLFRGGLPPAVPFPGCGEDPSSDGLSCEAFEGCMFTFTFYGEELSGDAVIFVTESSVAMLESGELNVAKHTHILPVIEDMPDGTHFAAVFFDIGLMRFPAGAELAIASDETRTSGRTFVNQIPPGAGTCGGAALLSAIESARLSAARRKLILYVSGGGGCTAESEEVYLRRILEEVTLANSGVARIYTFEAPFSTTSGKAFLKDLAEQNGGIHVSVY